MSSSYMTSIEGAKTFFESTITNMLSTGKITVDENNAFMGASEQAYDDAYWYEVAYFGDTGYLYFQKLFPIIATITVSSQGAKNDIEALCKQINSEIESSGNEGYTVNLVVDAGSNIVNDATTLVTDTSNAVSQAGKFAIKNPKAVAIGVGAVILFGLFLANKVR